MKRRERVMFFKEQGIEQSTKHGIINHKEEV